MTADSARAVPFRKLLRIGIPVAIIFVGGALSVLAFVGAQRADDERIRGNFALRAEWRARDFESKLQQAAGVVEDLQIFVVSQKVLDLDELQAFAAKAGAGLPASRLAWAPMVDAAHRATFENVTGSEVGRPNYAILERDDVGNLVRARERDVYAPVAFEHTYSYLPPTLGIDQFSEPVRRAAAIRARDEGAPVATPIVHPIVGNATEHRIVLYWPVYKNPSVPATLAERRTAILGFSVGSFEVTDLLRFAIAHTPGIPETLSLIIDQSQAMPNSTIAAQFRPEGQGLSVNAGLLGNPLPGGVRLVRSFAAYGRTWSLVFDFPPELVGQIRSATRWDYLAFGMILTLILAGYVAAQQRRQTAVEALVVERTGELFRTAEQLQAIFDASPLATGTSEPDGRISSWNASAQQIFGYTAEEAIGASNLLTRPEDRTGVATLMARVGKGEVIRGIPLPLRTKDGSLIQGSVSAAGFRDAEGDIRGVVFTVEDITERHAAESELRRTQTLLKGIVDSSDDAIISKTLDGIVTTWNPGAESMFGYSAEEMIGKNISVLAVPAIENDMIAILARIRAGERVEHYETQRRRKDGTIVNVSLSVSPIVDAGGIIIGASKIARDITESKRIAAAEREVTERLKGIVDTAPDGIVLIDSDGIISMFNPAAEALFGYRAAEVVGRNVSVLVPAPHGRNHDRYMADYMRTGIRKIIGIGREVEGLRKNGSIFPMNLAVGEIKQGDRSIFAGIIHDLTSRRAADAALRRSQEHLALAQHLGRIGSIELDLRSNEAYWSDEVYRLFELDPATVGPEKLKHVIDATHPDDRPLLVEFADTMHSGVVPNPIETRIVLRDGTIRWLARSAQITATENGVPVKMLINDQDITERKRAEQALKEHFAQMRAFVEQTPVMIAMFDRAMNCVAASTLWKAEYPDYGQFASFADYERLSNIPEEWQAINRRAMAGETIRTPENRRLRANGRVQWLSSVAQPWTDANGEIGGVILVDDDISDRKRAEHALKEHFAQMRAFVAQAPMMIAMFDRDMNYLAASERWLSEYGGGRADITGLSHYDVVPNIPESWKAIHRRGLAGETVRNDEDRYVRSDGSVQWLRWVVAPWTDSDGRIAGIMIAADDDTARKQAELALRRSQEHLARVQEVARIGSTEVDLATGEAMWSDEIYRLLGYNPGALKPGTDTFANAIHPDDSAMVREASLRGRRGEEAEPCEFRVIGPDGATRWFYRQAEFLRDAQGSPVTLIATMFDITARKAAEVALRNNLQHLANAQKIGNWGSIDTDLGAHKSQWSDQLYRILGLESGVGETTFEGFILSVHPDDRAMVREYRSHAVDERTGTEYECRIVRPNGEIRWLHRISEVIRGPDGLPERLVTTFHDVTERKHAETALRRSEEHLTRVQRASRVGSTEIDIRTKEGYWSDEIYRMFGLEPGSVRPELEQFLACIHPGDRATVRRAMERGQKGERVEPIEFRIPAPNGTTRWLYRQAEFVRDDQGNPTSSISTYLDVTARKAAEAAQRAIEEQYRLTFDVAPVGIAHIDPGGRFILANRTLCTMFGYGSDELLTKTFRDITHPEDLTESDKHTPRLLDGSESILAREERYIRKDGMVIWCRLTSTLMRDEAGKPDYYIFVFSDITAVKAGAARRAELEEQLQQSQKMEAVGRLTGGVAHDFNNLLTVVLGNLELVRERVEGDARLARQVDAAMLAGQRGADLTHRLLAFSRRQALEPVIVDINKRLAQLLPMLHRTLGENIDIKPRLSEDLWRVIVDPSQLESAILNLAVNSRDAMPQGGKLEITTENIAVDEVYAARRPELVTGNYVRISVSDSGHGMPPDVAAKAFEPFYTTKEVGKGTGLGLSMIYGFVKQSGGHVGIYSELGIGTTLTLLLPAAAGAGPEAAAGKAAAEVRGSETVLVVEDDPPVRTVTVSFLEALGYRVIDAESVREGFDLFASNPEIDLILTDVILPGGEDGAALARRARELRPATKVLFMSGYTEDVVMHNGRLDPGVILLRKPFTRGQLAQKVRAALGGTP